MALGDGTDINSILPAYRHDGDLLESGLPKIGQILNTVVPQFQHPLSIYDAVRADQHDHNKVQGTIRPVSDGDFRQKPNRLPVFRLRLGDCEELLALRSKVRPCVVLAQSEGISDQSLPPSDRHIARTAFQRPSFLVAPVFSVSAPNDPRSVTPTIAARAECLVYPQLVFLPRSGGIISRDSVARLDRAFWTTLPRPTTLFRLGLSEERMGILQGQMEVLRGLEPPDAYIELVQLVRDELDPVHAEHLD